MRLKSYLSEKRTNFRIKLETKKDMTGHTHTAGVNADGDGMTLSTSGGHDHVHKIFQWLVQPAMGHTHNLED